MALNSGTSPEGVIFDHYGMRFDLMSLDIESDGGKGTITSSSGSSLDLNDKGTYNFVDFGAAWQNITSFTIKTENSIFIDNLVFENPPTVSALVPEPGTLLLLGAGLLGLAGYRGSRRRK